MLNGYEIDAPVDEQERLMLDVASGSVTREHLADWLRQHVVKSSWRAQAVNVRVSAAVAHDRTGPRRLVY